MVGSRPNAKNWDYFWGREAVEPFTRVSWSKLRIIDILRPLVQPEKQILDAGCGSGFFSKYFFDQGARTVALDYSSKALEIVARMTGGKVETWQKDLLADDFVAGCDRKFDVVFSDGLLEHFSQEQQGKILGNFSAVLNAQGIIVTFVPNKWSPWQIIRPLVMPGIQEEPFVVSELICRHEEVGGLSVKQAGGINVLPFRFSPDRLFGRYFGMLLFVIAQKKI